jgi:uncharacterized protein YbcV (DUF1398 family)
MTTETLSETSVPDAVRNVMIECTVGSDHERITFPEVVMKLFAAGIEHYHADLQRSEKAYFLADGRFEVIPAHKVETPISAAFDAKGVDAAVRAIQAGQIKYREFCACIAAAGCCAYIVSMSGRRAVYYGRTGETHVELFPSAN